MTLVSDHRLEHLFPLCFYHQGKVTTTNTGVLVSLELDKSQIVETLRNGRRNFGIAKSRQYARPASRELFSQCI